MIIAAYAGCGKTYLARHWDQCTEINSMQYARFLDEQEYEDEREKANPSHISNPLYPYNMIPDILKAEQKYPYVLIPTDVTVIRLLQREYQRRVVTVVPDISLQESYRQRYLERGNSEDFCRIFADGMNERIKAICKVAQFPSVSLNGNQYLFDYIEMFETFKQEYESDPVTEKDIQKAEQCYLNRRYHWNMYVCENMNQVVYMLPVKDVDDPMFHKKVAEFGKWYGMRSYGLVEFTKEDPFVYDDRIVSVHSLEEIKENIIHLSDKEEGSL